MICEYCSDKIEDGEEYGLTILGHYVHEEHEEAYWDEIKAKTVYATRNVAAEIWSEKEDMSREM